jgi:DNA topoisomerase VI subunit B
MQLLQKQKKLHCKKNGKQVKHLLKKNFLTLYEKRIKNLLKKCSQEQKNFEKEWDSKETENNEMLSLIDL